MLKRLFILVFVLLLLGGLFAYNYLKNSKNNNIVSGIVKATEIKVGSQETGRVQEILFEEGDSLLTGDTIAVLEQTNINTKIKTLQEKVKIQEIKVREVYNGYEQSDINSSKQVQERILLEYQQAQREAQRYQELYKRQIISKQELEAVQNKSDILNKQYSESNIKYKKLKQGYRSEQKQIAQALLSQYKQELKELEARQDELIIKSPCNCLLSELNIEQGNLVKANSVIALLIDTGDIWIEGYLPEFTYGEIQLGHQVQVNTLSGKKLTGEVYYIAPQAEFTPRNIQTLKNRQEQVYKVKIRLNNSQDKLLPGMDVNLFF